MHIIVIILLSYSFYYVYSDSSCSTEPACECIILDDDGIYADCSGRQLNSSPSFNENVTSINLSFNYLTCPPSNDNLPESLKHLNVSNNRIYNLSLEGKQIIFWKITGLLALDLSFNVLSIDGRSFFPNIFSNFSRLELLNISRNIVPEEGFS